MSSSIALKSTPGTKLLRLVTALLLAAGWAGAPAALASGPDASWLSVYGPGASASAAVAVQALSAYGWVTVADWQGYLSSSTNLGVPFIRWAVDPSQLGQGPFRAVIYSLDQKSIAAASDPFYLPGVAGINLAVTVGPLTADIGLPAGANLLGKTLPAPPRQAPELTATSSVGNTNCGARDCAFAKISVYVSGVPLDSWLAVEWQNEQGDWLPVPSWAGRSSPLYLSPTGQPFLSWMVLPAIYGHGPFRWAVYHGPNGGVLGVSPSFNLPASDRANLIMQLSP